MGTMNICRDFVSFDAISTSSHTQTLTAAAIIVQSSHHTLRAIIILETKRNAMIGNVMAASIMDDRTTSVLRDGCGIPLHTAVWRIVIEAEVKCISFQRPATL